MNLISINMSKARDIHRERIRLARKPLLEEQDILFQRALESGSDTSSIVTKKQTLRDATSASAIANAANITDLKNQWDTATLGTSPY